MVNLGFRHFGYFDSVASGPVLNPDPIYRLDRGDRHCGGTCLWIGRKRSRHGHFARFIQEIERLKIPVLELEFVPSR